MRAPSKRGLVKGTVAPSNAKDETSSRGDVACSGAVLSGKRYLFAYGATRPCCDHMGSRNPLYIVVFRASSPFQIIPYERGLL